MVRGGMFQFVDQKATSLLMNKFADVHLCFCAELHLFWCADENLWTVAKNLKLPLPIWLLVL